MQVFDELMVRVSERLSRLARVEVAALVYEVPAGGSGDSNEVSSIGCGESSHGCGESKGSKDVEELHID